MNKAADLIFVSSLLILSIAAINEAVLGFGALNPGASAFPLLTAAGMSVGASITLTNQLRNWPRRATDKTEAQSPHATTLQGTAWTCAIILTVMLLGMQIGSAVSILAYMRLRLASSWRAAFIAAVLSGVVLPLILHNVLNLKIHYGLFG